MIKLRTILYAIAAWSLSATTYASRAQEHHLIDQVGGETIRSIGYDLCLPANGEEYEALGKNAIVMLTASTAIAPELPLKSVFVEVDGVRVPLQRLARSAVAMEGDRAQQISFYLIPIQLTKRSARLAADFKGSRKDFGIGNFHPGFYPNSAPAFVRLDEYDNSSEPDPEALASLLAREYPDFFGP